VRLDRIHVGDLVLARIKGRSVYGEVLEITDGHVRFRPLCPAAGWRHASAREIVPHWRKTRRRGQPAGDDEETRPRLPREQLSLPGGAHVSRAPASTRDTSRKPSTGPVAAGDTPTGARTASAPAARSAPEPPPPPTRRRRQEAAGAVSAPSGPLRTRVRRSEALDEGSPDDPSPAEGPLRTRRQLILEVIGERPGLTVAQLSEATALAEAYLYRVLPAILADGQVLKHARGLYLSSPPPEVPLVEVSQPVVRELVLGALSERQKQLLLDGDTPEVIDSSSCGRCDRRCGSAGAKSWCASTRRWRGDRRSPGIPTGTGTADAAARTSKTRS